MINIPLIPIKEPELSQYVSPNEERCKCENPEPYNSYMEIECMHRGLRYAAQCHRCYKCTGTVKGPQKSFVRYKGE